MSNQLIQPFLNPVKFHEMDPVLIPQYVSRFMDDHYFVDTIRSFEQPVRWCQPWQISDSIREQFISNYSPLTVYVKNEKGHTVGPAHPLTQMQEDFYRPGFFIYQLELDLAAIPEGHYYLQMECGSPVAQTLVSEPLIIAEEHPNTLYIEYYHYERYGDVIFDSPFEPAIRIPGILKFKTPGSKDTVYEDQTLNETMLKSVPFRVFTLIVGGQRGVPPWLIDKINRILGCSDLRIDGRYFTKPEGASWQASDLDNYPMAGWAMDLRERLNRDSVFYDNEVPVVGMNSMMAVIDSKGFGMDNDGGNFIEIIDVN